VVSKVGQERLNAAPSLDGAGCLPVHPGRAGSLGCPGPGARP
jgi:hypothetical protein